MLIKEEERYFMMWIWLEFEAIVSNNTELNMSIGLELRVGPFNKLFPEEK